MVVNRVSVGFTWILEMLASPNQCLRKNRSLFIVKKLNMSDLEAHSSVSMNEHLLQQGG